MATVTVVIDPSLGNVNGGEWFNSGSGPWSTLYSNNVSDHLIIDLTNILNTPASGTTTAGLGNYSFWGDSAYTGDTDEATWDTYTVKIPQGWTLEQDYAAPPDNWGSFLKLKDADGNVVNDHIWIAGPARQINVVTCFAAGSEILVPKGSYRKVEDLKVGDEVQTIEGPQRIIWVGSTCFDKRRLTDDESARPILYEKGSIGNSSDLLVSRQHKVLLLNESDGDPYLVKSNHLKGKPGVSEVIPENGVEYYHILLERHSAVYCSGIWSESFFPGEWITSQMDSQDREALKTALSKPTVSSYSDLFCPVAKKNMVNSDKFSCFSSDSLTQRSNLKVAV